MRVVARPVEVDAWEWTGKRIDFPQDVWSTDLLSFNDADQLVCRTNKGPAIVHIGDFLIRGRGGELYPIPPATYFDKYARLDGESVAREISAELGIAVTYDTLRAWFDTAPLLRSVS